MTKKYRLQLSNFLPALGIIVVGVGLWFGVTNWPADLGAISYNAKPLIEPVAAVAIPPVPPPPPPPPAHLPTPVPLRGIYMTQCVVGTPSFRAQLVKLINETELNSVVIDIRDYSGKISFRTDNPVLQDAVSDKCGANDMPAFIASLHEAGIYVIGRITTFQNPYYTSKYPEQAVQTKAGGVWKHYKGLAFVDVGAKPYWENVVVLGREAYKIGFDELNFDYIRFPSDGPMSQVVYTWSADLTRAESLKRFFQYLRTELGQKDGEEGPVLSVDFFGLTTNNYDDLGIGQVLEDGLTYFDYVAPMIYPSHYPPTFMGYKNPAEHPYEVIKYALDAGVRRAVAMGEPKEKIRPWLQDFDLGAIYTAEMVKAQMQATYDAGLDSWLLWDPSNKYTPAALNATITVPESAPIQP